MNDVEFLLANASAERAKFDQKLISTKYKILGVQNSLLEKYAKANAGDEEIFVSPSYHEQIVLWGYKIAFSKSSPASKVEQLKALLPFIDNWGSCDAIVVRLKGMQSEQKFFENLTKSPNPFSKRFGIVWLMRFVLKEDLQGCLKILSAVSDDNYYVKMALAWAYAEAFTFAPEFMTNFLEQVQDKFVRNQTITKACQSFRTRDQTKAVIKKLRLK